MVQSGGSLTNRTKQLLLELMLLRLRYSANEFRNLERGLVGQEKDKEIRSVIDLVYQLDAPLRRLDHEKRSSDSRDDIQRLRREFVSSLRAERQPRPMRQAKIYRNAAGNSYIRTERRCDFTDRKQIEYPR
jgi:hypothetical protein